MADWWANYFNAVKNGDINSILNGQFTVNGPQAGQSAAQHITNGILPQQLTPNAPGSTLDTSQSDDDKQRMADLIQQLQGQASTGSGAWEQTLAQGTKNAQNTASALGQSQANQQGGNAGDALRNIGNAQSSAAQRAVGQGNILRAESEQGAQDQLSTLLGEQGSQDVNQSALSAGAASDARALQAALNEQARSNILGGVSGGGQAVGTIASASDGGRVPGSPKVVGDNEVNDTVPAMLSPGEIVVPRTKAKDPQAAARFAAEIARHHGKHMAGGGDTGDGTGLNNGSFWDLITNGAPQAPSIQNGGLLPGDNGTRNAAINNAGLLAQRAAGQGPSVAPQELTNAQDASIATGMNGAGPGALQEAVSQAQGGAGTVAKARAGEQSGASDKLAHALLSQRQNDLALAQAQQQAAFRNTQRNAGLSIANQAALRNVLGGGAQAATAFSGTQSGDPSLSPPPMVQADAGFTPNSYSEPDQGEGSAFGPSDTGMAQGGLVRPKLLMEHPSHYEMEDAKGKYRIHKEGLSEATHAKIRSYAEGGIMVAPPPKPEPPKKLKAEEVQRPYTHHDDPNYPKLDGDELVVQRAQGGSVPGYDDGGAIEPRRDSGPTTFTGADLGLGGGFAPNATVGPVQIPNAGAPSNFEPQQQEKPAKTLVQVGTGPNGQPVVEPRDVLLQPDLPKGLRPKTAAAPQSAAKPSGVFAPNKDLAAIDSATAEGRAGLQAQGAAESQANKAKLQAQLAEQTAVEAQRQQSEQRQALARQKSADAMSRFNTVQADMAKMDDTIDPNRYWASRSTGGKIAGIIGLVLGSFGTGPDGINRAAQMMNQAIERDLEVQKTQHEIRLKKGAQAIEGAKTYYSMAREALGDEVAASSAAHGAILEDAARKTAIAETQTADPVAKAKLQQLQAALTATGAEKKIKAQTELETANAAMIHAQAAREALGQKNSKTTGLTEGALRAVDDLERELETNPSSPRIAQLRASLALEINKLQGGRFNEEIHKMNNALTPGNEDFSVARRLKAALSPGANKKDFDILREHIRTTGSVPPNPTYEAQ